jgi:NTP pyrophosphatase (non-canonical NTP hydrolase)
MLNRTTYLLVLLIEECAEVIQRVCKAIRFGLNEVQQSNSEEKRTNERRLAEELADLQTIVCLLQEDGTMPTTGFAEWSYQKRVRILKYLRYSIALGLAEPGADIPKPSDVTHTVK